MQVHRPERPGYRPNLTHELQEAADALGLRNYVTAAAAPSPSPFGLVTDPTEKGEPDPDAVDPEGSDPDVVDPEGSDPDAVDPEGSDPDGVDPLVASEVHQSEVHQSGADLSGADPSGADQSGADQSGADLCLRVCLADSSDPDRIPDLIQDGSSERGRRDPTRCRRDPSPVLLRIPASACTARVLEAAVATWNNAAGCQLRLLDSACISLNKWVPLAPNVPIGAVCRQGDLIYLVGVERCDGGTSEIVGGGGAQWGFPPSSDLLACPHSSSPCLFEVHIQPQNHIPPSHAYL